MANLAFEFSLVPMMGARSKEQRNSREHNNNEDPLRIIFQTINDKKVCLISLNLNPMPPPLYLKHILSKSLD
jgi:hypothetical protein